MERLLVTTALEGSWDETQPMLFLGEWCRLYSRRHRWSELDVEVLPYHWDDREQFVQDRRFLKSLHEKLLVEVSEKLNEFHSTDHSSRYWRILLGPWLGYFTQTLFDRWSSVHHATRDHELSGTIVLKGLEDARVPNDMEDFFHLGNSHSWNHFLYGRILTDFADVPRLERQAAGIDHGTHYGSSTEIAQPHPPQTFNLKTSLVAACSSLSSRLMRPTDCFIHNTGLRSLREELALQRRLGQVPRLVAVESPADVPVHDRYRRWDLGGTEGAGFEPCLRSLIPEQMPTAYLEGYGALCDESDRRRWPSAPKVIFTGGSHFYDDVFKEWCAARTEEGTPLVIGQHGGHIGTAWSFDHDHQIAIADRFLSWGWSDPAEPKVVPIGMLKAPIPTASDYALKDSVLLVTSILSPHFQSFDLASRALPSQFLGYLEDQFTFVAALSPTACDSLTVRLSAYDLSWSQQCRWRHRFPEVLLDDGRRPIMDLLAETRLCIATSNGTTYLESFFLDVPTVIFWDTTRWELLESAVPYFEDLARVGVFHDTPESAASHVSAIWSDVQSWWSDDAVVDAVTKFKRRYCDDPGHVLDEMRRALLSVAREVR
ncbi:MAG: transferase [Chloroflexi bacterium]|nr:transferase [Chloroflexota bacterium]